ncbi:MAG: phosphoglycerate dehydrogenase [Candidatus Sericytochromatia bacterium]|nr:phosphoglycerate dehydrogenase [Candidatus Sericytochromatia bacterium]
MTARAKILVCDGVAEEGVAGLREEFDVTMAGSYEPAALAEIIGDYDALIVRSQTKVDANVLAAGKKLRIVARAGVGVDNVDVAAATREGIVVVNSPDGNTIAAAEHTLAMMFSLVRHTPQADASMKTKKWEKKGMLGIEMFRKTLGVVGLGKIGSHVAKVCQAMGMQVIAFDPFMTPEVAAARGVQLADLDEVLAKADMITLHMPLTPETRHVIDPRRLALMKPSARLVNCARGGLIDEVALADALQNGRLAGAALDVFEQEPLGDSPLYELGGKIVMTPHLGASTAEAQLNVAIDVAEQVAAVLRGDTARSAVNIQGMGSEALQAVRPYLGLAERLGRLLGQIVSGGHKSIEITLGGELAGKSGQPLVLAVLKGFLEPSMGERVNYVNAPLVAHDRGITVKESKSDNAGAYSSLITATAVTTQETRVVAGTLIGQGEERIVLIDDYSVNTVPSPFLLLAPHQDQPGMVGILGTILGESNINIAGMQVGRLQARGQAVMVVNIDEPMSKELVDRLSKTPGFHEAKVVKL